MDLWVYQEIIADTRPDLLVECGTGGGGSALFFANVMDLIGHGMVVTVDVQRYDHLRVNHPRIAWLHGSSTDPKIVERIHRMTKGRVMLVLDSDHRYEHVKAELEAYADMVAPGCYLVVEDTGMGDGKDLWADLAVSEFLLVRNDFSPDIECERHLLTFNHLGWLRRAL